MPPTPPRHAIRLGDAWEQPERAGDRVRLVRRFGRPSGIGPDDRLLLVIASATVAADVSLNGAPLPPITDGADRWEQDVTHLLRERNELAILIPDGLLVGDLPSGDAASRDAAPPEGVVSRAPARGSPPGAIGRVAIEIIAGP